MGVAGEVSSQEQNGGGGQTLGFKKHHEEISNKQRGTDLPMKCRAEATPKAPVTYAQEKREPSPSLERKTVETANLTSLSPHTLEFSWRRVRRHEQL